VSGTGITKSRIAGGRERGRGVEGGRGVWRGCEGRREKAEGERKRVREREGGSRGESDVSPYVREGVREGAGEKRQRKAREGGVEEVS